MKERMKEMVNVDALRSELDWEASKWNSCREAVV